MASLGLAAYVSFSLALVTALVALGWFAWTQRKVISAFAFLLFLAALICYLLANLVVIAGASAALGPAFLLQRTSALLAAALLCVLALQLAGRSGQRTRWGEAALGAPAVICLLLTGTNPLHHWIWSSYQIRDFGGLADVAPSGGELAWLVAVVMAIYNVVALLLIGAVLLRLRVRDRQLTIAATACALALVATAAILLADAAPPPVMPILQGTVALAAAYAIVRLQLYYARPRIQEALMETMVDGMLALDRGDRIIDMNLRILTLLGITRAAALGRPLAAVAPAVGDAVAQARGAGRDRVELELTHDQETHYFDLQVSTLRNRAGESTGAMLMLYDISQRRQAEQALRDSEAQLRAIVDHSPMAVILFDPDGRILLWSAAAEKIYGWTAAEVIGRTLPTVPEKRQGERLAFQARVNQGELIEYTEVQRKRKDGEDIFIGLSVAPLVDASGRVYAQMSLSANITARVRAEQALRESEEHYRQLLENVPVPVAIYAVDDDAHPILYANEIALERWQTLGSSGAADGPALPLLPEDEHRLVADLIAAAQTGRRLEWDERRLTAPNGEQLTLLVSSTPVTFHRRSAVMVVIDDITELTHAQAELRQQEQALALLQERERLSRELHDGLGQALGYLNVQAQATEAMLAGGQTAVALSNLRQMTQVAQEAHADLRRHILGLRAPAAPTVSFHQTLDALLRRFTATCGIQTVLNMPPDAPRALFTPAVEEQVFRIIQEALANVRKHSGAHVVEVLFTFTSSETQVVVDDDGVGFDAADPAPDHAPDEHFGLAIMRERAEQIGGRLEVRSSRSRGAQVVLHVPTLAPLPARAPASDLTVLQKIRVLLVDDHPLFLDGMRTLLRARGITVVGTAANGVEAQAMARSLQPDVVVMDVEMPACDGVEATLRIKTELPAVKIIILTVSEAEENLVAALRNGASGYLLKSLDANQFCQYLASVIRGETVLPPGLAARVLSDWAHQPSAHGPSLDSALTPQQQMILRLVAEGKLYKEIALELDVAERTVKYHMGQILDRLHLNTRAEAIAYARQAAGPNLPD